MISPPAPGPEPAWAEVFPAGPGAHSGNVREGGVDAPGVLGSGPAPAGGRGGDGEQAPDSARAVRSSAPAGGWTHGPVTLTVTPAGDVNDGAGTR